MDGQMAKRQDERRELGNAYLEYRPPGKGLAKLFKGQPKRALLSNLSKSGLAFRTTDALPLGETISASLQLPGARQPVQVKLETLWQREERKVGTVAYTHIVGARFTEYSPEAWQVLSKLMKDLPG